MTTSSISGGERAARRSPGKDVDALGPSDSSDSGSDIQGEREMATGVDQADELGAMPVQGASDSDARGTGERGSATGRDGPDGGDIAPDRIEGAGDESTIDDVDLLAEEGEEPDPQDELPEERGRDREPRRR
ncbi:MAG: hypothetical protein ABI702_13695 [Burkholderiales bacterium]